MSSLAEFAPAIPAIAAGGVIAVGACLAFRRYGRRRWKVSDEFRSPDDNTKWVLGWNDPIAPIDPSQLIVYTGTARPRLPKGEPVEAEILQSDELTRKLARS